MVRARVGLAAAALALGGCGSTVSTENSLGVCVEDPRSPAGCQTSWTLLDPCTLAPGAATLEAAVFADACPADSVLAGGDTSQAIQRQSAAPDQALSPTAHLALQQYGFALVLRDDACHVVAWGCTNADLHVITQVQTAVRDWSATDTCTPATGGACTAPATCSSGACR